MATSSPKPTARQLRYLRQLAYVRGVSFAWPTTIAEASREIDRLKALPPSSAFEERLDRRAVVLHDNPTLYAPRFRMDEIQGYGSTASWAAHQEPRVRRGRDSDAHESDSP